jgi:hypothetical protein
LVPTLPVASDGDLSLRLELGADAADTGEAAVEPRSDEPADESGSAEAGGDGEPTRVVDTLAGADPTTADSDTDPE